MIWSRCTYILMCSRFITSTLGYYTSWICSWITPQYSGSVENGNWTKWRRGRIIRCEAYKKNMNWRHQGKNYCSIFKLYQVVCDLMNFITALSIYIYVCEKFRNGLITARSRSKVVAEITTLMEWTKISVIYQEMNFIIIKFWHGLVTAFKRWKYDFVATFPWSTNSGAPEKFQFIIFL